MMKLFLATILALMSIVTSTASDDAKHLDLCAMKENKQRIFPGRSNKGISKQAFDQVLDRFEKFMLPWWRRQEGN